MSDDVRTVPPVPQREAVEESYGEVLARVERASTQAEVERLARTLQRLAPGGGLRPVRLALVGSFTVEPLAPHLTVRCHKAGLRPEIFVAPYGRFQQQLLAGDSELYRSAPEIVFLSLELDALVRGLSELPFLDVQARRDALERAVDGVDVLRRRFSEHSRALLVVHNFVRPSWSPYALLDDRHPGGLGPWYRELNERLSELCREDPRAFVLDMDGLVAWHGSARASDPRLRYLARMAYAEGFLPMVADAYMGYVKALLGLTRKCIVLDLDNTLWGGIVGEDGMGGLMLGPEGLGQAFVDFQKMLLALHRRGVILAICSKNDEAEALRVLREHPHMVLKPEHFAAWRINWGDKVTNLRGIAREINIGLDSLVFFDDNPAERYVVRAALPEVLVPDLPDDPALFPQMLASLNDFSTLVLTSEDMERGRDYARLRARREFESVAASLDEYLAGLETVAEVARATEFVLPRLAQLTQRTNQFNLTTRRYSLADMESLASDPSVRLYSLRLRDRFGDSGTVGCAVVMRESESTCWRIDTLLLSCRVIGRGVETAFLAAVASDVWGAGAELLVGEWIPSGKNGLVADFFPQRGFRPRQQGPDGRAVWELSFDDLGRPGHPLGVPPHIRLEVSEGMPQPGARDRPDRPERRAREERRDSVE
ncbi:MAG: HAD-IIIC family phosphatase [Gemmatimonadetes bacterium]|nr:HAD-IIIC family phosphatase [Gemmatimonadota bacterium]